MNKKNILIDIKKELEKNDIKVTYIGNIQEDQRDSLFHIEEILLKAEYNGTKYILDTIGDIKIYSKIDKHNIGELIFDGKERGEGFPKGFSLKGGNDKELYKVLENCHIDSGNYYSLYKEGELTEDSYIEDNFNIKHILDIIK